MYQINTHLIGMNAGKVWNILQQNKSLTQHQIQAITTLDTEKFNQAIGWLSKENKIRKDGEFYSLAETNLDDMISENAGVLVTVLKDLKESVEGLEELTKVNPDEFHLAVGWLAREGYFKDSDEQDEHNFFMSTENKNEQIQFLHEEIEDLNDELVSRNHIINELTRQLTNTQTRYIQDLDVIERLHAELDKTPKLAVDNSSEVFDTIEKINQLKNEISSLHAELNSRNHIIGELSRQLTSTQTTIISQADQIERLNSEITKKSVLSGGSVSQSLRQRLRRITQLQKSLDTHQDTEILQETKFYDTHSPVLDISQSQHFSNEELREALEELHQDIDDKIGQKKLHFHDDDSC